jgi:hypothetical protein
MHESIAALPRLIRTHRWPTDAYLMQHGAVASAAFTALDLTRATHRSGTPPTIVG